MAEAKAVTVVDGTSVSVWTAFREAFIYRELIFRLLFRGIRIRYTQSVLGPIWVLIEPVMSMIVFTLVFSGVLNVTTGTIPYPLFNFSGLVIWTYFVNALSQGTNSFTSNMNLVSKVYVPRLILPLIGVLTPLLDLLVAFVLLLLLMLIYGTPITATIIFAPLFVIVAMLLAFSLSLWLAIINTRFRDVGYGIPMILRVLIYTTPVIYPASKVPENWRWVYDVNPMAHVVQGFRWSMVQGESVNWLAFGLSLIVLLVVLISGLVFFQHSQRNLIDRL